LFWRIVEPQHEYIIKIESERIELLQIVPACGQPGRAGSRRETLQGRSAQGREEMPVPAFSKNSVSLNLKLRPLRSRSCLASDWSNCHSYNAPSGELHRRATENLGFAADHH
jgi:hypothetical protein